MRSLCAALLLASIAMVPGASAAPQESEPGSGVGPLTHFKLWQDDPLGYVVYADGKAPLGINATYVGSDLGLTVFIDSACTKDSAASGVTVGNTVSLVCKLPRGHYTLDLSLSAGMVRGTLRVTNGMLQGAIEE